VNNVLGFPYIFRGALDVRASAINIDMKIAATKALADLAKQDVPDEVANAYSGQHIKFGPEYIIPKPFDARLLTAIPPAVATSHRGRVPSVHLLSHATAGLPSGSLSGILPSGPFNLLIVLN